MTCQWRILGAGLVLAMAASRPASAQQNVGTVTGLVTDVDAKTPITDVTVIVVGTNRAARANAQGRYRIVNVPTGTQQVRAYRLGYASVTQPVTVADGATAQLDFALHSASTILQQVVVTGTATQNATAREDGASIGIIPLDSINPTPITNFSELLNSRTPGLTVLQNAGTLGTGSRILIRGVGSTSLNNQPLIIVDGIRAYNDIQGFNDVGGLGGQLVSRFDDLDHEDIADVQVLKGPAAAALYGTQAAAGVIVIQTRRGEVSGSPRWHLFGNIGRINDVTTYPAQYTRAGVGRSCSNLFEQAGVCTGLNGAGAATPATSYNLVDKSPTFANGYDEGVGASVTGGSPAITYFVGTNWDRQQGIYHNNQDRWTHLNAGVGLHPYSQLDLGFTAQYTQRRTALPLGDNAIGGILSGELLGSARPGGYFAGLSPQIVEKLTFNSNTDRFTIGSNGTLRLLPWLTAAGTAGVDYVGQYDSYYQSQLLIPQLQPTGQAAAANNSIYVYTGSASLSGKVSLLESLQSTTTFGGEWVDQSLKQTFGFGQGLAPGTGSLAGATSGFNAFEVNNDVVNIGGYLQEAFGWRNVLYLTVAGRLDGNSAFGRRFSTALYPSGNLSYNISDERFWPKNDAISSLRFRFAAGQSGRQPLFRQAQGSFTGAASFSQFIGNNVIGVIANTYSNPNLKPERSTEYETGFDIGLFKERLTLTVTAYDKFADNLVQAIPVDISTGIGAGPPLSVLYNNLGKVDNRGLELSLSGTIFRTSLLGLDLNTNFAMNRNRLLKIGQAAPVVIASGVTGLPIQQDIVGKSIGAFFATPYTYADANHDGIIEPNEIHFLGGASAPLNPIGEVGPRDEWSVSPTVTVLKYLKVNALFDRRDGITVYDGTDAFRCLGGFQRGRDCVDPKAPLKDQAAAIALNGVGAAQSEFGYLSNGSFVKFRELSFTLSAPDAWSARFLGGHSASITISGRNLKTWTNYRGLDPEINQNGPSAVVNSQFFTQPPVRYWLGRVDISW